MKPRRQIGRIKKAIRTRRALPLILAFLVLAPEAKASGFLDRWSIGLSAGSLFSMNGRYSSSAKLSQMVLPGSGMGLNFKYRLGKSFFLDAGYGYNWMFIKKDRRPDASEKSAFCLPFYTLNASYFLSKGPKARPYVTLGGGFSPWWFASDAFGGTLWRAPAAEANFSKVSGLVNGGLGLELGLWSHVSLCFESKYYHVFTKDKSKFGTDAFTNQGLLGIRLGITYHIGSRTTVKQPEEQKQ